MYFPFAKDEAGQKAPYKIEKMKYYLIAGEPSGDLHGANLIRGLQKADPGAEFRFWGGDCMAAAGGAENLRKHYRETSFFGIVQVLKNLGTIRRQMRECQADVAEFAPDVLILVDYPGFNMKMARWAKEHGIRTFYYIAPKVWAWREWRVKAIRRYVGRLFIIFPFERTYFPKHGITPVFEGNPLVDAIEARRTTLPTPEEFRRRNSLDQRPIVALLAGSRRNEIRDNLPLMAALSQKFPERQFVVAGVAWLDRALYEQYTAGSGIRYVCDQTYETLAAAEAAVVTSGTATLETALLGIPEVVVYRTVWWQVWLRPYVLKVPWVSLVNLNLGREAVAEIIQSDFSVDRAERELRAILHGGSKRGKMLADFGELKTIIGGPGASERFAARMVAELHAQKMHDPLAPLLAGAFVIVCGLLVKRFPMLISGYNTLPKEKRKNVDIDGLSSFMRRHLVIIGGLLILFTTILELTGQQEAFSIILAVYLPVYVIWMVVRAQRYDHNK